MKQLFVVVRSHGPAWQTSRSPQEQKNLEAHASFMNALEQEQLVLLGGPLEGTFDTLLVVQAGTENEVLDRLSADLRLGSLPLRENEK